MQCPGEGGSGCFKDLAVTDARGANAKAFCGPVDQAPDALEVHIPTASGEIMGVTDSISKARSLPANVATLSHGWDLLRA